MTKNPRLKIEIPEEEAYTIALAITGRLKEVRHTITRMQAEGSLKAGVKEERELNQVYYNGLITDKKVLIGVLNQLGYDEWGR